MKQMTPQATLAKQIGIPVKSLNVFYERELVLYTVRDMMTDADFIKQLMNKEHELLGDDTTIQMIHQLTGGNSLNLGNLWVERMLDCSLERDGWYDNDDTADQVRKYLDYFSNL
jgi:hypothetical protein